MNDPDGYFGEDVAAGYDETSAVMFADDVLGPAVGVTVGDFATTRVAGDFAVAYLVFNTIGHPKRSSRQPRPVIMQAVYAPRGKPAPAHGSRRTQRA
jgi:hypothetical protein